VIPFAPQLLAATACLAIGFGAGWKAQGWRWDASLKEQAESRVAAANEARNREHEMAAVQATIAETLERSKQDALRKKDRVIDDLRSGAISLPIPASVPGPGETASAACQRNARETREFLGSFVTSVATLTAEADLVAEQLAACQAIVRADRKQ
jgi:hypothetical protein